MDRDNETGQHLRQQVELLGSRDWRIAAAASEALADAGSAGMAAVLQGLSHPHPRVRRGCAGFMDHQGTDECVERLLDVARHDPVPAVRRVALHSLGCQRCKPVPLQGDLVAFLIERALSDSSLRVRQEAVSGLMSHRPDTRAAAALETILEQATDRELLRLAHHARKRHDTAYRRAVDESARARSRAAYEARQRQSAV